MDRTDVHATARVCFNSVTRRVSDLMSPNTNLHIRYIISASHIMLLCRNLEATTTHRKDSYCSPAFEVQNAELASEHSRYSANHMYVQIQEEWYDRLSF